MPEPIIAGLVVGLGVVVGLVLLAGLARPRPAEPGPARRARAMGMSAGMLLGGILGAIVWISSSQSVSWVIFAGGGMVLGLAVGTAFARRRA